MDWSLKHSTPHHQHQHQPQHLRLAQQQHDLQQQQQQRERVRRHQLGSRYTLSTSSSASTSSGHGSDELYKREDTDDAMLPPSPLLSRPNSLSGVYFPDRFSADPGYAIVAAAGSGSSGPAHAVSSSAVASYASPSGGSVLHAHDASSFGFSASAAIDPLGGSSLHSLDLQHFDETASVDLQQLFPAGPAPGHAAHALGPMTSSAQQQLAHADNMNYYASTHPSADYFAEGFPSYHTDAAPSLSFAPHAASAFDDRDELGTVPEMQEVSSLFSNAPMMMTPPTSVMTSRSSIVSPMHALPPSRSSTIGATLLHESSSDDGSSSVSVAVSPKFSPDRRKLCCIEGCKSQARAFNRCKRHGGSKRCSSPGCTKSVQSRGLCIRHGGGSRCQESGCVRAAQSHGRCKMHGGGRPCIVADCEKKAHLKRLCRKHGGGAKCSLPGCDKWAQRQGMCMTHSKHIASGKSSVGVGGSSTGADADAVAAAGAIAQSLASVRSLPGMPQY